MVETKTEMTGELKVILNSGLQLNDSLPECDIFVFVMLPAQCPC